MNIHTPHRRTSAIFLAIGIMLVISLAVSGVAWVFDIQWLK